MSFLLDMSVGEFRKQAKENLDQMESIEKEMARSGRLRRCPCGNAYLLSDHVVSKYNGDPKECPSCRGDEGDLVL